MHADKEIVPRETLMYETGLGRHDHRVGVLDEERGDRRPIAEVACVAGEDWPDTRLIENAGRTVDQIGAFDQSFIDADEAVVRLQRAATLVLPGAGHRGQTDHRE